MNFTVDELARILKCPASHAAGVEPKIGNSGISREYILMHLRGAPPAAIAAHEEKYNMRTAKQTLRVTEGFAAAGEAAARLMRGDIRKLLAVQNTRPAWGSFGDIQLSHTPDAFTPFPDSTGTMVNTAVDLVIAQNRQFEDRDPWTVRRNIPLKLLLLQLDPDIKQAVFVTASVETPSRMATYLIERPFVDGDVEEAVGILTERLARVLGNPANPWTNMRCEECDHCRATSNPDTIQSLRLLLNSSVRHTSIQYNLGRWELALSTGR